jgi:signal transduction histidine kinase
MTTLLIRLLGGLFVLVSCNAFAQPTASDNGDRQPREFAPFQIFDRAEFVQSASLLPPDANAKWEMVELPDSWRVQNRPRDKIGWYRLRFTHDSAANQDSDSGKSDQRAIYISRITNNIEIFLNGSSFAISGRLGPDPEESWNLAQYHFVPPSLTRNGTNELLIRLHPDGYARAGLSKVYLGNSADLREIYNRRYFIQTKAPQLITGVLVVMSVFSLTVWLRRRNETMFLLFGLMAAVAVVRLFHHYFRDTPLWLAAMAVPAVLWLTVLQTSFALHYGNRPLPRLERGLMIYAFGASAMLLVAAVTNLFAEATQLVYASLAMLSPVLGGIIIYQLSRAPSRGNILMMVATLLNSAFGIHDFLNYQELLGYDRLYLLPLGLPLLLLAVAALLVRRFVDTLNDYETLNTSLSARIAGRERDLAASFERERELDQQRATADERQKLMRDMHDGLGSHLMSTLALLKRGSLQQSEVESLLADCIDELKLTIDSLEPVERDLAVVLGNLRYRLEPRLNAAGISLEWAVTDLPPLDYLDPENVRSVLRIVQEAFTNTLKHANASRITLSTGTNRAANRVWVRVTDDGQHFDIEKAKGGRGLANMKSRAARMQGEIEVVALKGGGTCVSLFLPIQKQKPPIDGHLQLLSSENARQT